MPTEIERKFLVNGTAWKRGATGKLYRQGYLVAEKERTVRVRVVGEESFLTIKGPSKGIARAEYEYRIPPREAAEMLDTLCLQPLIEKYRYRIEHAGLVWEVDEFLGENQGLTLAEVELADEDQAFSLPDWAGEDVSHDPRYYNANLVRHPFSKW
ncbi:MAG TPA: CYTH domain-containing protein [Desulfuromonadales bacterium]|nr:CYTH domain-containing protein [Desulfuromonadales bacterium]